MDRQAEHLLLLRAKFLEGLGSDTGFLRDLEAVIVRFRRR
jgi:hypothetical protein